MLNDKQKETIKTEYLNERKNEEKAIRFEKAKIIYLALSVFLCLGIIGVIYINLSISNVSSLSVEGNIYTKQEEILELSGLSTSSKFVFVDSKTIENKVKTNELFESCSVKKNDDRSIVISVKEKKIIGYGTFEENNVLFLQDNSHIILNKNNLYLIGRVPLIEGFTDEEIVLIEKNLANVDERVINEISEIHYYPDLKFQDHEVIMRDGNYIFTSVYGLDILNKYHNMASVFTGDENRCYYIEDISGNAYTSACPWQVSEEESNTAQNQETLVIEE